MKRRKFIRKTAEAITSVTLPFYVPGKSLEDAQPIRIGVVADVHQDIIHDGYARLRFFIDDMKRRKPDFIIQLGDFSLPRPQNQIFLDVWNEFDGPSYHVLGNHDMKDFGYTKEETMSWWGMEERFYSFDRGGFHFIILDGNDENPSPWEGYHRYIGREQKEWLSQDLASTDMSTILFVHQSLEAEFGIANGREIRSVIEEARFESGKPKVVACLTGHHHTDYVREINGIFHVQINSMSYKWVGDDFQRKRFADHIEQTFPMVRNTCPYKDPLYTVVTLDSNLGRMNIEGRSTGFIAPDPVELGVPNALTMHPTITESSLSIGS